MSPWRRREPLHRRLAREAGVDLDRPREPQGPLSWAETGVHGVPRAREWDAVVVAEAPEARGDEARFLVLGDGRVVVESGLDVEALAAAAKSALEPPFRAEARRRTETQWVVGLRRTQLVELPQPIAREELTLTSHDGFRELLVDGEPSLASVPELEALGEAKAESYSVSARRVAGSLWEVRVAAL